MFTLCRVPRRLPQLLLVAALVLVIACQAEAAGRKKGNRNRNRNRNNTQQQQQARQQLARQNLAIVQSQLAAAQQAYQAAASRASALEAEVTAADARVSETNDALTAARQESSETTATLRQIEEQLENAQPEDSPYRQAEAELAAAREAFLEAKERVFESPAYRRAYEAALRSTNKAELLPQVRSDALAGDAAYLQAKQKFDFAQQQFIAIRTRLLEKSEEWVAAGAAARTARQEEAEADTKLSNAALGRSAVRIQYRAVARQAAAAQEVIQQAQAAMKNLQGAAKSSGSGGKSSGGK